MPSPRTVEQFGEAQWKLCHFAEVACERYRPGLTRAEICALFVRHVLHFVPGDRVFQNQVDNHIRVLTTYLLSEGSKLTAWSGSATARGAQLAWRERVPVRSGRPAEPFPHANRDLYEEVSKGVVVTTGLPLSWFLLTSLGGHPDGLRTSEVRDLSWCLLIPALTANREDELTAALPRLVAAARGAPVSALADLRPVGHRDHARLVPNPEATPPVRGSVPMRLIDRGGDFERAVRCQLVLLERKRPTAAPPWIHSLPAIGETESDRRWSLDPSVQEPYDSLSAFAALTTAPPSAP